MDTPFVIPAGHMRWQRESYQIAVGAQGAVFPETVAGAVYRGLGLSGVARWWTVTHLGSGHILAKIEAPKPRAFTIATELAERFDWDWSGLNGWRNIDPELKDKMRLWYAANRNEVYLPEGSNDEAVAKRIGVARW